MRHQGLDEEDEDKEENAGGRGGGTCDKKSSQRNREEIEEKQVCEGSGWGEEKLPHTIPHVYSLHFFISQFFLLITRTHPSLASFFFPSHLHFFGCFLFILSKSKEEKMRLKIWRKYNVSRGVTPISYASVLCLSACQRKSLFPSAQLTAYRLG